MTGLATIPAGTVDEHGSVVTDVPCRKCGYNLRGLNVETRCPECGAAVGFSIQGDFLQFSDPIWLDTLANGARIYIYGVALMILGGMGASALFQQRIYYDGTQLLAFGLMTLGWWKLTEPDPSGLGEDRYGTSRKIIRFGLLGGIVKTMVDILAEGGGVLPSVFWIITTVSTALSILWVVSLFAQLNYLRKLSLRIPDPALEKRSRFLTWAIIITFSAVIILWSLFAFVASAMGISSGNWLLPIFGLALWTVVLAIMYLLLVEKMGKRFRELATVARRTWAASVSAAAVP
jgi:hypothetical protein